MKNWREIKNDKSKYAAYLCSAEWGQKRRAVEERSHGICEHCGKRKAVHTHHNTYERKYDELLTDLDHLCQMCHDFQHGRVSIEEMYDADFENERLDIVESFTAAACARCRRVADLVGRTGANWYCETCSIELQDGAGAEIEKKESA